VFSPSTCTAFQTFQIASQVATTNSPYSSDEMREFFSANHLFTPALHEFSTALLLKTFEEV
jgi:hypothetical protein